MRKDSTLTNTNKNNLSVQEVHKAVERGYYGIAILHSKHEENIGTLLRSGFCLGAKFITIIGKKYKKQASDTVKTWRHIPLHYYSDFEDFFNHGIPYSCELVGVELCEKATSLIDFEHKERVVYLLGSEDNGLPPYAIERCHQLVQLPGLRCLNVAVTGSIVLYDRIAKLNKQ